MNSATGISAQTGATTEQDKSRLRVFASSLLAPWAESIDTLPRWQGRMLDALGYGPVESPWRPILRHPALTLRAYTDAPAPGPVVLIIPAPIKKGYIWDLAPGSSVVRQLANAGAGVYLVYWQEPGRAEQNLGLADYADRLLLDCVQAVQADAGPQRVFLAGHSLGGTLAVILAMLHPELVAGLLLLSSPLHFGPEVDALSALVAAGPPAASLTALSGGNVPGAWLDISATWAAPGTFILDRQRDLAASLRHESTLATHMRTERWMLDETPLPKRLFEEILEWLYREDRLARGRLEVSGKRLAPEQITFPLLFVVEAESSVAPPASMRPIFAAARSKEKRWLWYHGDVGTSLQHAGMLVGRTAHCELWPRICRWLRRGSVVRGV